MHTAGLVIAGDSQAVRVGGGGRSAETVVAVGKDFAASQASDAGGLGLHTG